MIVIPGGSTAATGDAGRAPARQKPANDWQTLQTDWTAQCIIAVAQALNTWHPKRCWAQDGRCGCPSVVQVTDVNSFSNWACLPAPPATRSSGPGPAWSCCPVQPLHARAFVEICVHVSKLPKNTHRLVRSKVGSPPRYGALGGGCQGKPGVDGQLGQPGGRRLAAG